MIDLIVRRTEALLQTASLEFFYACGITSTISKANKGENSVLCVTCIERSERLSPALSSSLEEGRRRGAEERWTEETTAAVAAAAGFRSA